MPDSVAPDVTVPRQSLPRNVKILGGVSLLNDVASEAAFPLLPRLLSMLDGAPLFPFLPSFLLTLFDTRFLLGFIEGTADSIASILKLFSGSWSDRVGKRKGFVVFGYSLTAVVRPLLAVIVAPWQLLLIRVSERIGKGIRNSPRDAVIADSTDPSIRGRAFGFHRAMDHLGAAIGPLLAAGFLWMWPDQMRWLFFWTILPGVLVVALLVFGLREPPVKAHRAGSVSDGSSAVAYASGSVLLANRNFRLYLLSLVVFTLGNSSDAFLLYRAGELGVPDWQLPMIWCIFHIAKSTANLLLGHAVDRFGSRPLLFLGWLVYALIYLAFAVATTAAEAWIFFLLYALFYGLTEPSEKTLVAELVGKERKGLAYGWYNFAIGIATLPANLLFGALYRYWGALTAFGWGAALAAAAVLLLLGVRGPQKLVFIPASSSPVEPG